MIKQVENRSQEEMVIQPYLAGVEPARIRFKKESGVETLLDPNVDAEFLERFLIHYSSRSVAITSPVQDWLNWSAEACETVGFVDLARVQRNHAREEAGHEKFHIADSSALVARWNARRTPRLDGLRLLKRPPTKGAVQYIKLHLDTMASKRPAAQIALQSEIEELSVEFGPKLLAQFKRVLGDNIVWFMTFMTSHIEFDSAKNGHTAYNRRQLAKLLAAHPDHLETLVLTGTLALDSFSLFLRDCVDLAETGEGGLQ
jgi:hypothetical protein